MIKAVASAVGLMAFCYGIQTLFVQAYVFVVRLLVQSGVIGGVYQEQVYMLTLWTELLIIPALYLFYRLQKKSPWQEMGYKRCDWRTVLLGAVIGLFACFAVTLIFLYVPFPAVWQEEYTKESEALMQQWSPIYTTVLTVVVAPLTEELLYRGLLYGRLRRGMHPALAAVISAAVFGYAHGSPIWMVYTFLLGLLLAFLFERSDSLWPSIITHMSFNIFGQISIFPEGTPPIVMLLVYLMSPYIIALLVWRVWVVTKKPIYLFEQVM